VRGLLLTVSLALVSPADAQQAKPNVILIVADDLGYGDTGPYGGSGAEAPDHPSLAALGIDQTPSTLQSGGNIEGKEIRFGTATSALFATVTTDSSSGAVNAMHDSFTPLVASCC
jgi:hypothetical protein